MDIKSFQSNFRNKDIKIKPYIIVVSILISIILVIVTFNNRLEDYYINYATVKDKEVKVIVSYQDLENIVNNKKIIIERNIFTYKIKKINDIAYEGDMYKEVVIDINDIDEKFLTDNNVIKIKIITDKTTIINYLFKTMKGEWSIKQVNNEELKELNGGGIGLLGAAGIVAGAIFLIGVVDGYVRPQKCD